jgi:hypothetical protein
MISFVRRKIKGNQSDIGTMQYDSVWSVAIKGLFNSSFGVDA